MNGRESVTERNVARLLARAYAPVGPREAFRTALERAAREAVGGRPRAGVPRWAWSLAAAAAVVLAFVAYRAWHGPGAGAGPQSILERGLVAVLDGAEPGWRALELRADPVPYTLGASARLATPRERAARVELGPDAAVDVAPDSAIALERAADADCVVLRLESGRAELRAGADGRALEPGVELRWCAEHARAADAQSVVRPDDGAGRAQVPPASEPAPAVPAPRTPQIRGRVRGGDGLAAEAELVELDSFHVSCVPALQLPSPRNPTEREFTHAAGRFEIDGLAPGEYAIWVNAPGRAAWVLPNVRIVAPEPAHPTAPIDVDARLPAGERLEGRVVEAATGAPVSGALVISEGDTPANIVHLDQWAYPAELVPSARTGADGTFAIERLRSRATILRATRAGFGPAWLKLDPQSASPLELRLGPGAIVRGRVEDAAGAPAPDVTLVVAPTESGDRPLYWVVFATTGPDGEYEAGDLPAGRTVVIKLGALRDRAAWGPPQSRYPKLEPGAPQRADFLATRTGASISGRLLDAQGTPIPDRGLSILPRDKRPEEAEGNWLSTSSAKDGAYEFAAVPPGEYDVYASPASPMEVVWVGLVTIEAGRALQHDIVTPAGSIIGSVVDPAGAPVAGPVLIVHRLKAGSWCFSARVLAAPDGRFTVPFLVDGDYRVSVVPVAGLLAAGRVEPVHVAGDAPQVLELRLEPGASLDLTVVDGAGLPVADAAVQLFDESGLELEYKQNQATDAQGQLSFVGFAAGRLRVVVNKPGFAALERELQLSAGQAAVERFELQAQQR